jgi:mRNA-degrading endonuclease RelE of RelBE toxin-antitoxin system
MSEEFKRKLEAYEKGELAGRELEAFEKELAKLEQYQRAIEDKPDRLESRNKPYPFDFNKQQKIIRKSKWKARIQTGFTVVGLFVLVTIISAIFTSIYYAWGEPDRGEVYRNVIDYTLTVTEPYGDLGGTSVNTKPFFGMEATRELKKRVGKESIKIGELEVNFLLSLMAVPNRTEFGRETQSPAYFILPEVKEVVNSDWNQLEKLPEGTVASVYLSFHEHLQSKEVEAMFSDRPIDLIWYAVDTGIELKESDGYVFEAFGFPSFPIWHDEDMIQETREESGSFLFGTVSESYSSPPYEEGDQEVLHEQFMKTLTYLKDYENKAKQLTYHPFHLEEQISYLETNGISHYGAVVTGPTKELLALQEEPEIRSMLVDEVELWNWN